MTDRDPRNTDYIVVRRSEKDHDWRWTRYAANHEPIGGSLEGYESRGHALAMAESVNPGITIETEPDE